MIWVQYLWHMESAFGAGNSKRRFFYLKSCHFSWKDTFSAHGCHLIWAILKYLYFEIRADPLFSLIPAAHALSGSDSTAHEQLFSPAIVQAYWQKSGFSEKVTFQPPFRQYSKIPPSHCKKSFSIFPSPAGMSLTKLSLGRNNLFVTS